MPRENSDPFKRCPALSPAMQICSGILLYCLSEFSGAKIVFTTAVIIILNISALHKRRTKKYFLIAFFCNMLGMLLAYHAASLPQNHFSKKMHFDNQSAYIQGRITDRYCNDPTLPWLPPRYRLEVEITAIKTHRESQWHTTSGKATLRVFPEQLWQQYQTFEVQGSIIQTDQYQSLLPGSTFRRALDKSKKHEITINNILKRQQGTSLKLTALRNKLIHAITKNFRHDKNKCLAAAIIFGHKKALRYKEKQDYLLSGSLHLFAVSGLHTAFAGSLILVFLSFVQTPRQWRYILLPVFTGIYIIMVGMPASAVRAWIFISLWSFSRVLKRPLSFMNIWALAMMAVLIPSPLVLFSPGFQYSFFIVLCLHNSWAFCNRLLNGMTEKKLWKTQGKRQNHWLLSFITKTAMSCTVAFLASLPITLLYNGIITPAALISNFLIIPFLPLVFISAVPATLGIPGASWFMERLLDFVVYISSNSTGLLPVFNLGTCSGILTLLFMASLLWCLSYRKIPLVYRILPLAITATGLILTSKSRDELFLFRAPGKKEISILYIQDNRAFLVNAPGYEGRRLLASLCRSHGISHIECLIQLQSSTATQTRINQWRQKKSTASVINYKQLRDSKRIRNFSLTESQLNILNLQVHLNGRAIEALKLNRQKLISIPRDYQDTIYFTDLSEELINAMNN